MTVANAENPAGGWQTDESARLSVVLEIARLLGGPEDERASLERVCETLLRRRAYASVEVVAAQLDGTLAPLAQRGTSSGRRRWDGADEDPLSQAIRGGVAVAHYGSGTASAAVPFHLDETVAVLVATITGTQPFPEAEVLLLECVADEVARALENTRMRGLLGEERDRALRSRSRLRTLWTLAVGGGLDVDSQAQAIISEGSRTLGFQWGAIGHTEGGSFVLDVVVAEEVGIIPERTYPLDVSLAREALERQATFAHHDLVLEPRYALSAAVVDNRVRAFAAAPFAVGPRRYVLAFGSAEPLARAIDVEDRSYIDTLASFFSQAMRQREDEATIRYLQNHDALTGLPNRERFLARLDELIESTTRRNRRFAILTIDAHRFRRTVAEYGSDAGDEVIAEIARRLSSILLDGEELFRAAGDAFVAIVPDVEDAESVDRLARSIVDATSEPVALGDEVISVSASVGMALYPDDGATGHALTIASAVALRRAKRSGIAEYGFFSSELDDRLRRRRRLVSELKTAVDRGDLRIHYQPYIELATGRVTGVEALVRWEHHDYGAIEPSEFVALAEESDLIHALGRTVFAAAMHQAAALERFGPLTIAVNLSPRQLGDPALEEALEEAMERAGVDPERVELEVTERATVRDFEHARNVLTALRGLGCRIALDDFGIGSSSLAYLKRLPVDTIKIDQFFVRGLPNESSDIAIAGAILTLASTLGLSVRAEGVERLEQANWLSAAGCTSAQGYLFARPIPANELLRWLAERPAVR